MPNTGRLRAIHEQHRTHQIGLTRHWLRRSEPSTNGEDTNVTSHATGCGGNEKLFTLLELCVPSLRRGHANLLCIVPILTDDPRRESNSCV